MPLLVDGRRVRLPQSAGDLVRAHPLLEVSRARAGGYEAGPREPAGGLEPSSACRRRHRQLSPESGSKLGAAEVLSAHPERGLEASVGLLPSLDLTGHLRRPPSFSRGGGGGPERLGDLPKVAQHRGWRTRRDPLSHIGRSQPPSPDFDPFRRIWAAPWVAPSPAIPTRGNGATCLTHCDGSDTKAEVPLIVNAIKSFSDHTQCGRLEVHLMGGFNDDRQLSQKLTHQLLSEFDRQEDDIHLVTLCVTELNDREENESHFPIIYGIAVNIKTAEIYRASFQDRGPEEELRAARALTGGPMISIYDAKTEQLRIGPYSWTPFPHVDFWLQQDDKQILENLSTSPLAEPPHFVEHIRSTLMFLKKHPSPANTLFPGNKALLYKKNKDGLWEKISSPGS
uniref:RRN3 homolog, RNA polymerase I transcription factor n=1 Tax=Ovis aries TaxID=9940 RepID=A0AC11DTX4_SHEEP